LVPNSINKKEKNNFSKIFIFDGSQGINVPNTIITIFGPEISIKIRKMNKSSTCAVSKMVQTYRHDIQTRVDTLNDTKSP
jgi:hypothetical protein